MSKKSRSKDSSKGSGGDIWSLSIKALAEKGEDDEGQKREEGEENEDAKDTVVVNDGMVSYLLFVGSRNGGKSTLVSMFLNPNKEEKLKPTVALEYKFGRSTSGTTGVKDIAHIWELGGGAYLSELINVPITPQRLPSAAAVVVVDLSKPGDAIVELIHWLRLIRERVNECLEKMKKLNPKGLAEVEVATEARVDLMSHPDSRSMRPLEVPTVICGHRYDEFRKFDSTERAPVLGALRYIAHCYGASLICTSLDEKVQLSHFRSMLNHLVFRAEARKAVQVHPSKPLLIPAGADSIEKIGVPPGCTMSDITVGSLESRIDKWRGAVEVYFKPSSEVLKDLAPRKPDEEDEDEGKWKEPAIDAMRAQKEEELERYRKEAGRKLREAKLAEKKR